LREEAQEREEGGRQFHALASFGISFGEMELRDRLIRCPDIPKARCFMNQIIYLIGLIVVIMAILSFLGLR